MPTRPVLYVLAGVNGAGKSSIGGIGATKLERYGDEVLRVSTSATR